MAKVLLINGSPREHGNTYIPAEMGYGKFSQPGIPGGSTLIFEIELLGIA